MSAEILAPAGSMQALEAAVRSGADAVYIGLKNFNARRNADNFGDDEFKTAVEYCHKRGVKVYVTLNTLVTDRELNDVYDEIKLIASSGADAVITQDLGVARLIFEVCPDLPVHASTQMSVQSAFGARLLVKMGYSRLVLPRELSKSEIEDISKNSSIELEHFVHGAQCMCLSGQCLMSSVIGGRSGNRGLCAQPCRLPFGVNGKGGYNLSLKDMSLADRADELQKAGVSSLKIEGRMKRPEYVAAAVKACRNSLDGVKDEALSDSLRSVFSRSGFTSGYFDGKTGKEMFGTRTKEDVESAAPVLSELRRLYEKERQSIRADMLFEASVSEAVLTVGAFGREVTVHSPIKPTEAVSKELTEKEVSERLAKCGGTQFYAGDVKCRILPGIYLPASAINEMRREALSSLEQIAAETPEKAVKPFHFTECEINKSQPKLHVRVFSANQIPKNTENIDRIVIPLETDEATAEKLVSSGAEVAAEIPINVFSNADYYVKRLEILKSHGVKLAWCCGLDAVAIAEKCQMEIAGGFGMNAANTLSFEALADFGARDALVSSEIPASAVSRLGSGICKGVLLYGKLPLMVTRNCPVKNELSCDKCGKSSFLVDRTGARFPVMCKNGCSFILNCVPVCNFDRQDELCCDYHLLYFTNETPDEIDDIIGKYFKGTNTEEFTRGLHFRNVR